MTDNYFTEFKDYEDFKVDDDEVRSDDDDIEPFVYSHFDYEKDADDRFREESELKHKENMEEIAEQYRERMLKMDEESAVKEQEHIDDMIKIKLFRRQTIQDIISSYMNTVGWYVKGSTNADNSISLRQEMLEKSKSLYSRIIELQEKYEKININPLF